MQFNVCVIQVRGGAGCSLRSGEIRSLGQLLNRSFILKSVLERPLSSSIISWATGKERLVRRSTVTWRLLSANTDTHLCTRKLCSSHTPVHTHTLLFTHTCAHAHSSSHTPVHMLCKLSSPHSASATALMQDTRVCLFVCVYVYFCLCVFVCVVSELFFTFSSSNFE